MQIEEMRKFVSDQYPGMGWKNKVRCMPDNQVLAIYRSMLQREARETKKERLSQGEHQMTIWEL